MEKTLSIIIPFYNEIELIPRAVSSVYSQTKHDLELDVIVINDGSISNGDITEAIGDFDVEVVSNQCKKGPGGARNTGLELARGELIAFLDADDFWCEDKISSQLLEVSKGFSFICTGYQFEEGSTVVMPPANISNSIDIFLKQGVGTSTVLLTRKLLGSTRFNDYRFSQDIDFWYRLAEKRDFNFSSISTPLVLYYTGGSTKNKLTQAKSLMNVLDKNHISLFQRYYIMVRYFFRGVYNHYIKG